MSQKTILITGTNPGGIGNSLAREFHAKGLRVLATARNTDSIKDLADLGIETLSLEVTDPKQVESSIISSTMLVAITLFLLQTLTLNKSS
jgi:1-acylglycerone phosphate reductase